MPILAGVNDNPMKRYAAINAMVNEMTLTPKKQFCRRTDARCSKLFVVDVVGSGRFILDGDDRE